MGKVTVWNPWGVMPRDLMDLDDKFFANDDIQLDMYETKDTIVVSVKAAGFGKDDVHIDVESNRLSISGSVSNTVEEDDTEKKYYRKEIKKMSFSRSVDLPVAVVADKAKAVYKNGVLTVTFPKSEEAKPKKISVEFLD